MSKNTELQVGGFTPLTTIDYPDQLAAVIFLQGCPWRCRYCQNHTLLRRNAKPTVAWQTILKQLQQRHGFLDAVVFSGGEATLQSALPDAIKQVKKMGYKIGLHSAGIYPKRLRSILPLLDWIALDIKTTFQQYPKLTGDKQSAKKVEQSIQLILQSGIAHEFRTTVHPDLLSPQQLEQLIWESRQQGIKKMVLQKCVSRHCLDPHLQQVQHHWSLSRFVQQNQQDIALSMRG